MKYSRELPMFYGVMNLWEPNEIVTLKVFVGKSASFVRDVCFNSLVISVIIARQLPEGLVLLKSHKV